MCGLRESGGGAGRGARPARSRYRYELYRCELAGDQLRSARCPRGPELDLQKQMPNERVIGNQTRLSREGVHDARVAGREIHGAHLPHPRAGGRLSTTRRRARCTDRHPFSTEARR